MVTSGALDDQPMVRLWHPELGRETVQPASCARVLIRDGGWEPASERAERVVEEGDHVAAEFDVQVAAPSPSEDVPTTGDKKSVWLRYAQTQGYSGDGNDITKDELIEQYGKGD